MNSVQILQYNFFQINFNIIFQLAHRLSNRYLLPPSSIPQSPMLSYSLPSYPGRPTY